MKLTLFHGTLEDDAINILKERRFDFSSGDKHLLGTGIYLYEDVNHAEVWARMKAKHFRKIPAVLELNIEINDEKYFNLDYREPQDDFFNARCSFFKKINSGKKHDKEKVDAYYTDSKFCDFLVGLSGDELLAKTFVYVNKNDRPLVPVRYTNQKQTDRNITRHFRTEKQFCLKKNEDILDIKRIL
ncbi:hypothetical protein E4665_15800 [Sporolactobacillus shoreae]|uniref:DUF3990 domain-containing protein n=1 Tax=Sporolactobacillus shoreae TaxID=1465501 RepID=A0A4Z0GKS6_9BACL|nr:hypothetical protein [Sporolactobacillus shoreae]TGA96327.1 hypothetical protein E4665_15800 [Sporolactobacillus shoreae]